jgi:DNA polymerase
MSTEAYCRDPQFEILCVAVHDHDKEEAVVLDGRNVSDMCNYLASVVGEAEVVVCHNGHFDGFILESVLGLDVNKIHCTLTMPRFTGLSRFTGTSLANLSKVFGVGIKGDYLIQSKGKTLKDFRESELRALMEYCKNDTILTTEIYKRMLPKVPEWAQDFMSMTIKMYTKPLLTLNIELLKQYEKACEEKQKADMERLSSLFQFKDVGSFIESLRSPDKFCVMLQTLGAEVPMKTSDAQEKKVAKAIGAVESLYEKTIGVGRKLTKAQRTRAGNLAKIIESKGLIPALAKTDQAFMALMEDSNEDIALLANLRAENNSSIALSRAGAFIRIAERGGNLPVPLAAWGAQTGRYTAGTGHKDTTSDRINLQNLPKRGIDTTLRRAIEAPEGWSLVSCDSAQIEARVGAWVAGQMDLVEAFSRGEDVYCPMAAQVYGVDPQEVYIGAKKNHEDKYIKMRNVGKVTMLSSQYGIGAKKFSAYLLREGLQLDADLEVHKTEAARINKLYNATYSRIKDYRRYCNNMLYEFLQVSESKLYYQSSNYLAVKSYANNRGVDVIITLPNGFKLVYPNLHRDNDNFFYDQWQFNKWVPKKIYGASFFENLVQALAFAIVAEQGVNLDKNPELLIVANIHDSWSGLTPDEKVETTKEFMVETMSVPPAWAKGLPLSAEAKAGKTYEVA